jgi:hypothetical protein
VYHAVVVLAESLADALSQSDVVAIWSRDRDDNVNEMHDGFVGRL